MCKTHYLDRMETDEIAKLVDEVVNVPSEKLLSTEIVRDEQYYQVTRKLEITLDDGEQIFTNDYYELTDYDIEIYDYSTLKDMSKKWRKVMFQKFGNTYAQTFLTGEKPDMSNTIPVNVIVSDSAKLPKYAHATDAGIDLCAQQNVTIPPHETMLVPTGVAFELPEDCVGMLCIRSSVALKQGICLANGVGIIDSGYRDEVKAALHNMTDHEVEIHAQDRICQLVVTRFVPIDCHPTATLSDSDRGLGGFGSTGKK